MDSLTVDHGPSPDNPNVVEYGLVGSIHRCGSDMAPVNDGRPMMTMKTMSATAPTESMAEEVKGMEWSSGEGCRTPRSRR